MTDTVTATGTGAQVHLPFHAEWAAEVLPRAPMIAPARHFTWPHAVPGEEDALARGAMLLQVRTSSGGFLATCALGFRDPAAVTGVWSTPAPDVLLAVAGGYAYLADTRAPQRCEFLPMRPVLTVLSAPEARLLLLADSHHVLALDANGTAWRSERLSAEGLTLSGVDAGELRGLGWDMHTNRDVPFALELRSGKRLR